MVVEIFTIVLLAISIVIGVNMLVEYKNNK